MTEVPVCECHGEPKRWNKDPSRKGGGFWRCAVKHREVKLAWYNSNRESRLAQMRVYYEANRDTISQRNRERYDADWRFRIELILKTGARSRAQTIARNKEAFYASR